MSDLVDFLLLRVAEDEEAARTVHAEACDQLMCSECTVGPFPCDCGYPTRVLAECEAKRRIVEHYRELQRRLGSAPDYERHNRCEAQKLAVEPVLALLAVVYADHSDYRDEWRV